MKRYILLSAWCMLFFSAMNFGMQDEAKSRCIVNKPLTIEEIVQQYIIKGQYIKGQCCVSDVVINGKRYIIKQKLNSSVKTSFMKKRQDFFREMNGTSDVSSAVGQLIEEIEVAKNKQQPIECIYEEGELLLFERSEKMHKAPLLTFKPGKALKKAARVESQLDLQIK